jgi:hypothetical protein
MDICVYTHTDAHWCLQPFAYLFNIYFSSLQPVLVAGGEPDIELPDNFRWFSVESRVKERWSDGLIEFLRMINSDIVCMMLEDYWVVRFVDWEILGSLEEYMLMYPDVLKIDLTGDRLHSGAAVDVGYYGRADLVQTSWDVPYQWSTQAALWNRRHLLKYLRPGMSPWDFELQDKRPEDLRILGTRQWPVRYVNGVGMQCPNLYRTEHVRDGLGGRTIERIDDEHVQFMLEHGILPENRPL